MSEQKSKRNQTKTSSKTDKMVEIFPHRTPELMARLFVCFGCKTIDRNVSCKALTCLR
jgi:hypothetical protein